VVVTLGLIEAWRSPAAGNTFRQVPHSQVFSEIQRVFHRLNVIEMLDDLERIRKIVRYEMQTRWW